MNQKTRIMNNKLIILNKSYRDKKLYVISEDGQKKYKYVNEVDLSNMYMQNIRLFENFGIIEDWYSSIPVYVLQAIFIALRKLQQSIHIMMSLAGMKIHFFQTLL